MQGNVIHRPEEALETQSELIFVNGMVHLPHEWNFGKPTALPSPATPPSPFTATPEAFNITTYKIIATCILSALPCFVGEYYARNARV